MRDLLKVLIVAFAILAVAGTSFAAGFGTHWVLSNSPLGLPGVSTAGPAATDMNGRPEQFKVYWEAWDIIQREYYGQVPDAQEMTYGAIRGVIKALNDPNTVFIDPKASRLEQSDLSGRFEGIGAVVSTDEIGQIIIQSPMPGQPAEKAGIRAGDIILKVDGKEVTGMPLTEVVLLIRGPRGTQVKLTILRLGEANNLEFEITRGQIETRSVTYRMLEEAPGMGYIRLNIFGEKSNQELQQAIRDLKNQGAKSLIFDLRNNPGGFLTTAIEVGSQFIKSGAIVHQRWNDGRERSFNASGGGLATDLPIVLLVNKGSASASEIVAGAFKDYGRGTLIGEKTFGKGSVQNVYNLSDGSTLHVTNALWLTPQKHEINQQGIDPDIEVTMTDADIRANNDLQLKRAVEYLQKGS